MSPKSIEARFHALRELRSRLKTQSTCPNGASGACRGVRPELHRLEDRTVPAGSVKLSAGLLTITGTTGNDSVLIQQVAGAKSSGDQIAVTLNGQTSTFKVSLMNQITANLLAGNDAITLDESVRPIAPPSNFDSAGGTDSLIFKGTASGDSISVTGTTIGLAGAGTLTYSNFESLLVDCLGGNDTATMAGLNSATATTVDGGAGSDTFTGTFGTLNGNLTLNYFEPATVSITNLSGHLIVAGGPLANSNVTSVAATGSLAVSETLAAPNAGLLSDSTFGTISGQVIAGSIVNTRVTAITQGGSITAAGQGTTSNVSIGTLGGSFTAPEDSNAGSGTMSNTTINSITSTGVVSTGSISGMSVGTTATGSSITAAGQGTITGITIEVLSGLLSAEKDATPNSGSITHVTIGTISSSGEIHAGGTVTDLNIGTVLGGKFTAGTFGIVTAQHVIVDAVKLVESEATRTLQLTAAPGFSKPHELGFYYDGTGPANPKVTIQVDAGGVSNARGDLAVLTDTVGIAGSGIDLAGVYGNGKAFLRNIVVGGNITPTSANPTFFGLPANTPGGVFLPQDTTAVAVAGNVPAQSIVLQGTPSIAAGFFNGVAAADAKTSDATGLFAGGALTVQANDTFQVFVGDSTPVSQFLVTGSNGSNFDGKSVLFTDQGLAAGSGKFQPVTASVGVVAGSSSTIQSIDLIGEGASFQTQQLVSQSITVLSGSLGDVTLMAAGGSPANITAPRIVGSINVTNGSISGTIQSTVDDIGQAFRDTRGNITGVTFISAGAGGLTSTGKIISAGNLISLVTLQSSLDGVVAAQGDIGVIQTDASGNAVVGSGPGLSLTRFGGINVSTGGMKGSIVALGNVFGDINLGGGLDGRIAVKGRVAQGLAAFRTGILGNVNIGGGINPPGAIVSAGLIGDDGSNNVADDGLGTHLSISGATKGIIAAEGDINFGSIGNTSQAHIYENVGSASANGAVIGAIFTNGGLDLTITGGLSLILIDMGTLSVGADGNLTGTTV